MGKLRKNTLRIIGIVACSWFFIFFHFFHTHATARSYEVQFFSINLPNRLDYSHLKSLGVDKIIYRVFQDLQRRGGLYFHNTSFKTLSPALERMIQDVRLGGTDVQVCAWMITRKFKWLSNSLLFDYHMETGTRSLVPKLDVFNPDAVKKITTVFKELASKKIDCILIQDDFILRYNEGFSNWGKAKFSAVAGVPAREQLMMKQDTPYNVLWNQVKIDQLNKVLTLIVRNCKMVNSAIKVGLNVYYETPLFKDKGEAWYGHNLEALMATGIDYIYLMSYHRQIKDEMKLNEPRNQELFKRIVEKGYEICNDKLVVKLQVRDWKTGRRIPAPEVKTYLNLIPEGVQRICFTPVKPGDEAYLAEIIGGTERETEHEAGQPESGQKEELKQ